jgi:Fic-DOC domain mobile mystery protein B
MSLFADGEGNTPLSAEEQAELIPNLATKEELNEWERQNILEAYAWALAPNGLRRRDPLIGPYLRDLHLRMFDQTWKWAGTYRTTEKIGVQPHEIREGIGTLIGDARYWLEHRTYPADELAVRFHYRLVWIHPFANGNGRHARLMADVLAQRQERPVFSWGGENLALYRCAADRRRGRYRPSARFRSLMRAERKHALTNDFSFEFPSRSTFGESAITLCSPNFPDSRPKVSAIGEECLTVS